MPTLKRSIYEASTSEVVEVKETYPHWFKYKVKQFRVENDIVLINKKLLELGIDASNIINIHTLNKGYIVYYKKEV